MKIGELLAELRDLGLDLDRHHIYYLEEKGLIQPKKIKKHKIERNEYSKADLEKIKRVWQHFKHTSSLDLASKLVDSSPLDIFAFEDKIAAKQLEDLAEVKLGGPVTLNVPKVGRIEDLSDLDEKFEQILNKLYVRFQPDSLYLLAKKTLKRFKEKHIEAVFTLDQPSSILAGAMGIIGFEKKESFPEVVPYTSWLKAGEPKIDLKIAVIQGVLEDIDSLREPIKKLKKAGCELGQIIAILNLLDFRNQDIFDSEPFSPYELTSVFVGQDLTQRNGLLEVDFYKGS